MTNWLLIYNYSNACLVIIVNSLSVLQSRLAIYLAEKSTKKTGTVLPCCEWSCENGYFDTDDRVKAARPSQKPDKSAVSNALY